MQHGAEVVPPTSGTAKLDWLMGITDATGLSRLDLTGGKGATPPIVRWLGILWVMVSLPFITAFSAFFQTPDGYVFIFVFMASGAYTAPALVAGWYTVRHGPAGDKVCYALLYSGLTAVFTIGVCMLIGVATGWTWANGLGVPIVVVAGLLHVLGLAQLVRRRSGHRALSVDLFEALSATLAVTAPLVVLWGHKVLDAEARWWALPAAASLFFTIAAIYWGAVLLVRLGPGRGAFEICALALCLVGMANAALQTAQGISGFSLPAPPLIALHGLCMSQYLLLPLHTPLLLRPGLDRLPPQGQVRGSRMSTVVGVLGLVALLVSTGIVRDERPWAVPFSLVVVSLLFVLGALRQMAASEETKRLYGQVEVASEERRLLLAQLLERSAHDRRRFAGQLYEQAMAAYASFHVLAGSERSTDGMPSPLAEASARVSGDLARNAAFVRELVLAIRPLEDESDRRQRLAIPITAYLASLYDDRPAPRLEVTLDEELALDWISETVLLQIVQEALDNVRTHSHARSVAVAISTDGEAAILRVHDDGEGFDLAAVPERSGIATMRAAAAVVGGSLIVDTWPGEGTTITARLAPDGAAEVVPAPATAGPHLRLVRDVGDTDS